MATRTATYLIDIKSASPSSVLCAIDTPQPQFADAAERVVFAQRVMQARSPAFLQPIFLANSPFILRELQPVEDRLEIDALVGRPKRLSFALETLASIAAWGQLRAAGPQGRRRHRRADGLRQGRAMAARAPGSGGPMRRGCRARLHQLRNRVAQARSAPDVARRGPLTRCRAPRFRADARSAGWTSDFSATWVRGPGLKLVARCLHRRAGRPQPRPLRKAGGLAAMRAGRTWSRPDHRSSARIRMSGSRTRRPPAVPSRASSAASAFSARA